MDSLADLLGGRKREEPPEVAAIKVFVLKQFDRDVQVAVQARGITITADSAAFASTLRMHSTQIARAAGTDKKLFFRIG